MSKIDEIRRRWRSLLPLALWFLLGLPLAGFFLLRGSPSVGELGWLPREWGLWLDGKMDVRTLVLALGVAVWPAVLLAGRCRWRWVLLGVVLIVLLGAEVAQQWIPGRTFSWADVGYTILGVGLAEILAWGVALVGLVYRSGLEAGGAGGEGPLRVLIYGLNYAPELTGIGRYTGEMGPWLQKAGAEVRVVTTPPYYPQWEVAQGYRKWWFSREVVEGVPVWRCPFYVPARPTTVKRLLHLGSFAVVSFLALWRHFAWRPQVVFLVEPASMSIPGGLVFARAVGAKTWLHVQDFELEAMLGLGMGGDSGGRGQEAGVRGKEAGDIGQESGDRGQGMVVRVATAGEAWLKRRLDRVSSISRVMMGKLEERGVEPERVGYFPNWVDVDFMSPGQPQRDFKKEWGIPEDRCLVLYSGNIGKKQGLEMVVEVAARLEAGDRGQESGNRGQGTGVRGQETGGRGEGAGFEFVIVGDGAAREELVAQAGELGLEHVQFHPLQAYEDLPDLLRSADVHLVIQKKGAADAVLPSKLTSILSVGGWAVITAEEETELGRLGREFPGMVEVIEPEEAEALERVLVKERAKFVGERRNDQARAYAEEHLERDAILGRVLREMEELAGLKR